MLRGSILVILYSFSFVIVFGHFISRMFLNCFLWNASIFSFSVSVNAHSSLLYIIEFMNAMKSLIFIVKEMCFDLNSSLRFFMLSITSGFLLSVSSFVPKQLPNSLHFLQSGFGLVISLGL